MGIVDASLTAMQFTYLLFILVLFWWASLILKHACCWRSVVRGKLAVHNHLHHREKMALSMITTEGKRNLIPTAKSGMLGRLQRAARKVAIEKEIEAANLRLANIDKSKSAMKRLIAALKRLKTWYAHNFSLSLTFEGDSQHAGRFYGVKAMAMELLEVVLQYLAISKSTEMKTTYALIHAITLVVNTLVSPVMLALGRHAEAVSCDCIFEVIYMVR